MSRFQVVFKDEDTLIINDIIAFEQKQKDEIKAIAREYTKVELKRDEKTGKELTYLTDPQKKTVLITKDAIVDGKTPEELRDQYIVNISLHSNVRILKRLGSDQVTIIIDLINRVKKVDSVKKAQFKGHPSLSYTTIQTTDPEEFELPISFTTVKGGGRSIKLVTVYYKDQPHEEMETRISQEIDSKTANGLEELKQKLKERLNKGTTE